MSIYEVIVILEVDDSVSQGDEPDLFLDHIHAAFEPFTGNGPFTKSKDYWGLEGTKVYISALHEF